MDDPLNRPPITAHLSLMVDGMYLNAAEQAFERATKGRSAAVPKLFTTGEAAKCLVGIGLSAAQGHADAKKALPTVEHQLTSEQIAEGQRLARTFKPRKPLEEGGFDLR